MGLAQVLANQHSAVVEDIEDFQLLSEEFNSYPNQYVILFYSNLTDILLHAINMEQNVADSTKEWQKSLTVFQDFYRKHRKQILLFNLHEVSEQPQLFLDVCVKEWGCVVDTTEISLGANQVESCSQLLVSEILDNDEELKQILQHTKAMTWPSGASE